MTAATITEHHAVLGADEHKQLHDIVHTDLSCLLDGNTPSQGWTDVFEYRERMATLGDLAATLDVLGWDEPGLDQERVLPFSRVVLRALEFCREELRSMRDSSGDRDGEKQTDIDFLTMLLMAAGGAS